MTSYSLSDLRRHFFDYFKYLIDFVRNHCTGRELEAVILVSCALDGLSAYKFGGQSTIQRFTRFILDYSDLADIYEKVSLPELKNDLLKLLDSSSLLGEDSQLAERFVNFLEVDLQTENWRYSLLDYNVDIPFDALRGKALAVFTEQEYNKIMGLITNHLKKLHFYTYVGILWKEYRCMAVHELRLKEDRAGINLAEKVEPFYVNMSEYQDGKLSEPIPTFDIPTSFMLKTLENSIKNFGKECEEQNLNPKDFLQRLQKSI